MLHGCIRGFEMLHGCNALRIMLFSEWNCCGFAFSILGMQGSFRSDLWNNFHWLSSASSLGFGHHCTHIASLANKFAEASNCKPIASHCVDSKSLLE